MALRGQIGRLPPWEGIAAPVLGIHEMRTHASHARNWNLATHGHAEKTDLELMLGVEGRTPPPRWCIFTVL